jgi:hypothetical protein
MDKVFNSHLYIFELIESPYSSIWWPSSIFSTASVCSMDLPRRSGFLRHCELSAREWPAVGLTVRHGRLPGVWFHQQDWFRQTWVDNFLKLKAVEFRPTSLFAPGFIAPDANSSPNGGMLQISFPCSLSSAQKQVTPSVSQLILKPEMKWLFPSEKFELTSKSEFLKKKVTSLHTFLLQFQPLLRVEPSIAQMPENLNYSQTNDRKSGDGLRWVRVTVVDSMWAYHSFQFLL